MITMHVLGILVQSRYPVFGVANPAVEVITQLFFLNLFYNNLVEIPIRELLKYRGEDTESMMQNT